MRSSLVEQRGKRNSKSNGNHMEVESEIEQTTDSRWSLHIGRHGRVPVADGRGGSSDGDGVGRGIRNVCARARRLGRAFGCGPGGCLRRGQGVFTKALVESPVGLTLDWRSAESDVLARAGPAETVAPADRISGRCDTGCETLTPLPSRTEPGQEMLPCRPVRPDSAPLPRTHICLFGCRPV